MKQIILTLMAVLAALVPSTMSAHDFEVDGIYYKINGNEVTVTYQGTYYNSYDDEYSGDITIPTTVTYNGALYTVSAIGFAAFYSCNELTSITMPNSIRTIDNDAFMWCVGMTNMTISNSVTTIGASAFNSCRSLTNLTIPNSVKSIGDHAFSGCSSLTSLTIPNTVTSIGYGVFDGCIGVKSIIVASDNPKYDSRDNCNAIINTTNNELIAGCQNTVIPNTVNIIGKYAFCSCDSLKYLDIPNSVTIIDDRAFEYCKSLLRIDIPNSIVSIGESAFEWCTTLTEVTIPNSVITIGPSAFEECRSLKNLTIPNSITSIPRYAFEGCRELTSLTIPSSVNYIGDLAFYLCTKLSNVTCFATTPPIIAHNMTFDNITNRDAILYVPISSLTAYENAEYWEKFVRIRGIGDINGDGGLSISDVTGLIDILLISGDLPAYADVNGDGRVSIKDVTILIDMLLNGN